MNTIYLVCCLYTRDGITIPSNAGYSSDYETAKSRLHECIKEEKGEGCIPEEHDGWNDAEDEYLYETDESRLLYYVCSIEEI